MLMARADLDLMDVIALDKVQKGRPISEDEFKSLKGKKLVEGRRPNLIVSAEIAAATDPDNGLASVEALYLAYHILGRPTDGLLDQYHWGEEFLRLNSLFADEMAQDSG
jgi:ribosome biogenesis protein Tsr3